MPKTDSVMAIGNSLGNGDGDNFKAPYCQQSRTSEGVLPKDTLDPYTSSPTPCTLHTDTRVSLFCLTCENLVCFKCVSASPHVKDAVHRDHKYADLVHAYDIQKEKLLKKIATYHETFATQSNLRQKLLQRLQKLKFEVLRKKTQLNRCARSLKSKVVVNERACQRQLEQMVQPVIEKTDGMFQEVDYDVVSGSGLMGAAESLQQMSVHDRLPFLKNVCRVMHEIDALHYKHYCIGDGDMKANPPELLSLGSISIDRDRETRVLHKVFLLATTVPSKPKLLFSWCTVGAHSASIVWKYSKSDVIDKFVIKYHATTDHFVEDEETTDVCSEKKGQRPTTGQGQVTVNKFTSSRVQATLLGLQPDTEYLFRLTAMNRCGQSEPMTAGLQTSPVSRYSDRNVYFPSTEKLIAMKPLKTSRWNLLPVFVVCLFLLVFVLVLPRFLHRADPMCEKVCFGRTWCKMRCWRYVLGMEGFFRDTAYIMLRLLPRGLLPYILPQLQEEPAYTQEKWWLDWLDFEV